MAEEQKTDDPTIDPFAPSSTSEPNTPADPVAALVGEGKKYATTEEAVKALAHGQAHIAKIEAENKVFRDKLAALEQAQTQTKSIKDMIAEAIREQSGTGKLPNDDDPPPKPADHSAMTPDQVAELVRNEMQQQTQRTQQQQNLHSVSTELAKLYGKDAASTTARVAAEAGMTVEQLKAMAAQHPKAVLRMFKTTEAKGSPPTEGGRTAPPSPEYPTGAALHGLPGAHAIRPPLGEDGKPPPSVLRGGNKVRLQEEWKKAYPKEAVDSLRKLGEA